MAFLAAALEDDVTVTLVNAWGPADTAVLRKARGAFFTPPAISDFMARWAIRDAADEVLEPSAGDAEFMVAATLRLRELAGDPQGFAPCVSGVEIHPDSARTGSQRVVAAGGIPNIHVGDFFDTKPVASHDAVIGNPPYIRFQDFGGESRELARAAAKQAGVELSGLASSWAAFTVFSTLFLKSGGRLALVLPAELLSVNYAAPVRRFLFEQFRQIQLVLFDEQVFEEAEADVVLLLADGYGEGPAAAATFSQAQNAQALASMAVGVSWTPVDPSEKWTGSLVAVETTATLNRMRDESLFVPLEDWGDTTLGMVTGNNKYFALSQERVAELGLDATDLIRISPPGSGHLRGLALTRSMLGRLERDGKATRLFYPRATLSDSARAYIDVGHAAGVDTAYKCRVRSPWYRVPLLEPADLLLTYMNADTPRLTTNSVGVRHLNSVHGVYLKPDLRDIGRDLLSLASVNSVTLLDAELVGRAYGGGILKIEPREADKWLVPSVSLVQSRSAQLRSVKRRVASLLQRGALLRAAALVDEALFSRGPAESGKSDIELIRHARQELAQRRAARGKSGRFVNR